MLSLDWQMIVDWMLRYYFPVLILLPTTLCLCFFDNRLKFTNRKTVISLCVMLAMLILMDVINEVYSRQTTFDPWRLVFSVFAFCLRPACLLVLLLDLIPEARENRKRRLLLSLPLTINTLVFCSAFVSPLSIWFDANNRYHRGPLFVVAIIVCATYLVLLAYYALANVQRRNRRKGLAVLLITIACFFASFLEMNAIVYPTPLLNQTIAIGTSLYFLIQYMATSSEQIENAQLSLLLMQIRPHFINNSLAVIRSMIRRNPEKAVETLDHFSGYLQDSMNSILKTNLIPLSQEMELIDNYLYMENARFRDSITIHKELAPVNLLVPPLSIQPLVENAVRHGLRGIQTPGELTIRTEIGSREYRIIVTDNGCGFDTTQAPDPRREHVGIKNVRSRLELMCGGKLSIQSTPGSGTTATVSIPTKIMTTLQRSAATPPKQ